MLDYAIEKARDIDNSSNKYRIYAVAVDKRGRIVGESQNYYTKTHPIQAKYAELVGKKEKIYLHAEIAALIKARGKAHKVYVARVGNSGEPLPSCPCNICEAALKDFGVEKVEYID